MGRLFEGLNKDSLDVAHVYLQASWQEEGQKEAYVEDVTASLNYIENYLSSTPVRDQLWANMQMLKGELLRRVGRFDEAEDVFLGCLGQKEFEVDPLPKLIQYQLRLIRHQNDKPHTFSQAEESQRLLAVLTGKNAGLIRPITLWSVFLALFVTGLVTVKRIKMAPASRSQRKWIVDTRRWLATVRLNKTRVSILVLLITGLTLVIMSLCIDEMAIPNMQHIGAEATDRPIDSWSYNQAFVFMAKGPRICLWPPKELILVAYAEREGEEESIPSLRRKGAATNVPLQYQLTRGFWHYYFPHNWPDHCLTVIPSSSWPPDKSPRDKRGALYLNAEDRGWINYHVEY